ncbi:MAG TPA: hypothetical protein V6D08_12530 [Candidatus Obscuribacterales bacterium]
MEDFEKLGVFYLGRPYDLKQRRPKPGLVLYDSRDLLTHAVCVGMTGSGKTGLCVTILEEAAIDGIPIIAIDPKGDLASLMLTFPELEGQDFLPWISADEARRQGLAPEAYAAQQATGWRQGLAQWGQDGQRIARLRQSAEFAVYTPGSSAGLPVSILESFRVPSQAVLNSPELLGEKVSATVTSLLTLLGVDADPLRSREHILLSTILSRAWQGGQDLDVISLIHQIQSPPVAHIGAFDLEAFFPARDRFVLAMALNNLVAAPGFESWRQGEPLDIDRLLYAPDGRPRVSIFSIAHLSEAERMFFVALLLNEVLSWVRAQPGTTSLRALLYMDEIFGYCPPVANPPAKQPLLTLLKQARACGLGVLLATQNPVDLDYKGLSNAGTWFVGRLQTERDKARILEGLEGVFAGTPVGFDRRATDQAISGLSRGIFIMNNVHEAAPEIFQTRWTLSYLRGPLTRNEIRMLSGSQRAAAASGARCQAPPQDKAATVQPPERGAASAAVGMRPALPPAVPQYFLPATVARPEGSSLAYQGHVLGAGAVHFLDSKLSIDYTEAVTALAPVTGEAVPVDWNKASRVAISLDRLEGNPSQPCRYLPLPAAACQAKNYDRWQKDFAAWLYVNSRLDLWKSATVKAVSRPGESQRDFRIRLSRRAHEERDRAVAQLRRKYAPRIASLEERVRRAEIALAREEQEAQEQKMQSAISVGATLLGAFMGRRAMGSGTLSRATSAARSTTRAVKEQQDVARARETLEALTRQLEELNAEFQEETSAVARIFDAAGEAFEVVSLKAKKTNVAVQLLGLVWLPYWVDGEGAMLPAWH